MTRHELKGCAPNPFSSYLKAVGIFRILAEQKDARITACWENERLVLDTEMSREGILEFILNRYRPTPIVAPWSYSKYKKTTEKYKSLIESDRFQSYKETVDGIDGVIKEFCRIHKLEEITKSSIDKRTKPSLLRLCRNTLPDDAIAWLDAVFVLTGDTVKFAPILGTGGNDGNFDMAENFAKKLDMLLNDKMRDSSRRWLESALFGGTVNLDRAAMMGHNPDGAGGPNSGMGFEGESLSNPWEYVMMLEGSILFGGSIARRQSANTGKAVFPFTTNTANVGYATASEGEDGRGEIWLPIWKNPATYGEIRHVFNEGRVQLNGRQARTGVEFARAIASFGTERGISEFQQFCILKRKGDAYLTVNAGKMRVANEPAVHLISEIDRWYNPIIRQSETKGAPASLKRLVRSMDAAILNLCRYRKKSHMLAVLILIGRIERHVSAHGELKPLQGLSSDWLDRCYDGTAEFRLAASIASIKPASGVGGMRENLENVVQNKYGEWIVQRDSTPCVWKENDDLLRNMSRVLLRRGVDAKIKSADAIPIGTTIPARTDDIAEFLEGGLDMKKIGDLVLPLSLADTSQPGHFWRDTPHGTVPLPEAYVTMKMVYPPDKSEKIPFDMSVLNLLSADRADDAYARASYMLYSHGMPPRRYSKKIGTAQGTTLSDSAQKHVMASLLFAISHNDRKALKRAIIQPAGN